MILVSWLILCEVLDNFCPSNSHSEPVQQNLVWTSLYPQVMSQIVSLLFFYKDRFGIK